MTRVILSSRAKIDVDEITEYLAEYSALAVQRFREGVREAQQRLSQFPNSGRPGIRPGTRRLVVGNYIVSYRRIGDDVEIFAVRHRSRRDARF